MKTIKAWAIVDKRNGNIPLMGGEQFDVFGDEESAIRKQELSEHWIIQPIYLTDTNPDELREGLRKLEWHHDIRCPVCDGINPSPDGIKWPKEVKIGHKPDCWLAKLMEEK